MTIKELVQELQKFPEDTVVCGQSETSTWCILPADLELSEEVLGPEGNISVALVLGYRH